MARVFIIGGTKEARKVAEKLCKDGHAVMSSLAGVTANPRLPMGAVRVGGYGSDEAMLAFVRQWGAEVLIDCAHPFAVKIKSRLAWMAEQMGVPLWVYRRAKWQAGAGDNWHFVDNLDEGMALACKLGGRVFAALGRQQFEALAAMKCEFLLLRQVPNAGADLDLHFACDVEIISAYPPDAVEDELHLLRENAIDVILCKESGGSTGSAKLTAANTLSLPVIIIKQPSVKYPKTAKLFDNIEKISF